MKKKYRIGGILAGKTLTIDSPLLKYQTIHGKKASIPLASITSISVDVKKGLLAKAYLKIIGDGSELASIELPAQWATNAQKWLLDNLDLNNTNSISNIDQLEKLANLKEKGIITEDEFQAKKKKILDI